MYIVILITAKDKEEAQKIADSLVEAKLVACVNIVPQIQSVFWWQGKVDRSPESLLIVKTQKSLFQKVVKQVKSIHSYSVPEIIALPIIAGNKDYLNWITDSVSKLKKNKRG